MIKIKNLMNKIDRIFLKYDGAITFIMFGVIIVLSFFLTWNTDIYFIPIIFSVLLIVMIIFFRSDSIAITTIEIKDDNIIFTTIDEELKTYKLCEVKDVIMTSERYEPDKYYISLETNETFHAWKEDFKFYIEGHDNTYLFEDFFKIV